MIVLDCIPVKKQNPKVLKKGGSELMSKKLSLTDKKTEFILETEIIDTGIGIDEDRQKMLFVPFLELKMKQNLNLVKDNNIGMGLACSE